MNVWQPIDTAPRDRTPVDLWCVNTMNDPEEYHIGPQRFANCRWQSDYTQVPRWVSWDTEDTVEDDGWRATHWMPLPEGPA